MPVPTSFPGVGDAATALFSSVKAFAFAGPAVDTSADFGPAVRSTPSAGSATDAATTVKGSARGTAAIVPEGEVD